MNPARNQIHTIQAINFGIEIETIGKDRAELAAILAAALPGSRVVFEGGYYNKHAVVLADGRKWILMSDGSLSTHRSAEIVSPICTYSDLDMVQNVVRAARAGGARVDASCGIHIHVDATPDSKLGSDPNAIVRLAKLVYQQEELIIAALGAERRAAGHYTRPMDPAFVQRLIASRPATVDAVKLAYYGSTWTMSDAAHDHYHHSRYRGLNLHALQRGTVEFRYFAPSLHAGEVKAYIQLCLALAAKAITGRTAVARKRTFSAATAKYDVRVFLLRLGLIGDEFETCRLHLLKRLAGSASRKHGTAAPAAGPTVASAPAVASNIDAILGYVG